ncbi:MAG: hypothetical protein EOO11_04300 [Chitinophagaceae bacterium]|nr:MAG: hypothetical protein EOO11_04300 [Chitinophagaceae bacterium]
MTAFLRATRYAYPFLLPLFFVGHGLSQYLFFVPAGHAVWLLVQYLLAAALAWILFRRLYRDGAKAALATFVTLACYLFFGAVRDALSQVWPGGLLLRYGVLLPLWGGLWAVGLYAIGRWSLLPRLHRFLNLLLLLLIGIDAGSIGVQLATKPEPRSFHNCSGCSRPDVYLVVLDGYAGLQQLRDEFSFDNRPFYDSLRAAGFYVMDGSTSNYQDTPFSMASLLNMEYLPLVHFRYTDSNLNYCYERVYDNLVTRRFRNAGYDVRNYSFFDLKGEPALCENTLLVSGAALISSQTLGQRLYRDLYNNVVRTRFRGSSAYRKLIFEDQVNNTLFARETLAAAARNPGRPQFVYTHFAMPHAPYFFDAQGRLNKDSDLAAGNLGRKDLYLGYLQYSSRYTLDFIRRLRAASARPSVILLLSDHGFRYGGSRASYYSSLAAVSLPGGNYSRYHDSLTSVNQFRVLFNTLFRDTFSLVPQKRF